VRGSSKIVVVVALAACGDNRDPCDYHEADDVDNAMMAEDTNLAVGGGARSVCGTIEGGHYDAALQEVDVDRYRVTVGPSGDLLVELQVEDGVEALTGVTVRLFDTSSHAVLLAEGSLQPDLADHAAFFAQVPPGEVDVVVTALAGSDIVNGGTLEYRLRLVAEPFGDCKADAGTLIYREAHDGSDSTGNDAVAVDFSSSAPFSTIAGTPEPTGLTAAGTAYRFAGSASASLRVADQYLDRDTFAFTTGEYVNELAARVDWDSAAMVDLDYIVFEADTLQPVVTATLSGTSGVERQVFALRPRSHYWIWVGRYAAGDTGTTDAAYTVALCGSHFY